MTDYRWNLITNDEEGEPEDWLFVFRRLTTEGMLSWSELSEKSGADLIKHSDVVAAHSIIRV